MTNEAKVGAFTLAGLALLAFILVQMTDIRLLGAKRYTLHVSFTEAIGINPGSEVRFAGVDVGRVLSVGTDGMAAVVTAEIQSDIRIPRSSRISIASSGFLGEKFIGIMPGKDNGDYLGDGEYVYGVPEQTMDALLANMNRLVEDVHEMVVSMNAVVGDPRLQNSLVDTVVNVQGVTANLRDMTGAFAQMMVDSGPEVSAMVRNLNAVSINLMRTTSEVEQLVSDFSGDGRTAADLRLAIANLAVTSQRIDRMATSLEGVVTDPQTADDLRATLQNAREASEKANRMMTGFAGARLQTGVETMYSGRRDLWQTNFDLRLYPSEDSFLLLGFDDIGEGSQFNAQVGRKKGAVTGRFGIIDSKVGLGLDADAGDRWRFSIDAYDFNEVALKARLRYRVADHTYLFSQVDHLNARDRRAAYVGVRREF